ncbi:MAG: cupredoxin domain-containing protein [Chloroflexi bacterium]|nr:cupredoxin domain-containing protein [Chloroflexota bacterium]
MTQMQTGVGAVGRWFGVAIALVALVVAGAAVVAAASAGAGQPGSPIEIRIRYSRFAPDHVEVPLGRPVTIVLRNEDPIDHEWIVGDEAVHDRHRDGSEPVHAGRPAEVTVPAGEVRRTTVVFDRPGTFRFVCHLPGHESYGMTGTIVVAP